LRIAGTIQDSIVDGSGLRFTVFVQGCHWNCPGCQNPQTHDPRGGTERSISELCAEMCSNPLTDGLTLSGGEPFEQADSCLALAQAAHHAGLNVWCYTGFLLEDLLRSGTPAQQALLRELDVLVDGPFLLEERSLALPWRGSRNQRVLLVQESLRAGGAVLREEP
jgi:anaerobic ribonucleoside-triphosphate reductase activating protein